MNALELANILSFPMKDWETMGNTIYEAAKILRQQHTEIEEMKQYIEGQNRKILDLSFELEYAKRTDEFIKAQEK
jgi:hypothetical protein